ncbi:MAG: acyl-CoA synthetase [Proteobacteria bacterium]|nr:acyl-CoA synthetase [Pseudomonadota bacterium]
MPIFEEGLGKVPANHEPLTPVSFLFRAAAVHPRKVAIVHGKRRITYAQFAARVRRFADALVKSGLKRGETVAVMAPNIPALLEAHYAVPLAGGVLNALNYRLDAATIAFILGHGEAKILLVDREFAPTVQIALEGMKKKPLVVDIDDPEYAGEGPRLGAVEYEDFLKRGAPDFAGRWPTDEWQAICLLYTSGTTGNPKGVVYHHRGAYLNALGNALVFGLRPDSVYLWTLPMFHCSGWSYTWAVTSVAATHVCLRRVDPALIFPSIRDNHVTHMCGAPIVLNTLAHAPDSVKIALPQRVEVMTGGAAPPSSIIAAMEAMGFRVTHAYGLTESYGPATLCEWQPGWTELDLDSRARLIARQGVGYPTLGALAVLDARSQSVPADGATLGEIALRGNTVMKGYLKNPKATEKAFQGGWFRTGDLAVRHKDGYVEVKDRSKDIIISGGENISSLEVEEALYRHPAVMEAAVVAKPDEKWGETPCAFVMLKPGASEIAGQELIDWLRGRIARYKCPRYVVFGPLPKTSTGKIQKYALRTRAKEIA